MILKKCENGTEGCSKGADDFIALLDKEEAWEEVVWNGFKTWHLVFFSVAGVMGVIILLCCCVKFRIPRTKQEIEADYIRRQILRKFRKRLKAIQNQELDDMDLKKALDKIRAEFQSDQESEAGFSVATISSTTGAPRQTGGSYRRASQIQIDISMEELRAQQKGFGARFALAFARCCGRKPTGDRVALTLDAPETHLGVPEPGALAMAAANKEEGKKEVKKGTAETAKDKSKEKPSTSALKPQVEEKAKKDVKKEDKKEAKKDVKKDDKKEVKKDDKKDAKKDTKKEEKKDTKKDDKKETKKEDKKKDAPKEVPKGQDPNQPQPGPSTLSAKDAKKEEAKRKEEQKRLEKEKAKAEKEKAKLEKEKAKEEKVKLKFENEKAKKDEKSKKK